MRRFLDLLYRGSGALAAFFVAAIAAVTLLQVGANFLNALTGWLTGQPGTLLVPSYAEFGGFFLAAASFLALAYTLRTGGHIRVSLVIQHLTSSRRRAVEVWCLGAAAALSAYFAYYTVSLALESLEFGDVSFGMVPVPLWIPQMVMALGLVILTVALVDDLVGVLAGRDPSYGLKGDTPLTEETLEGE